MDLGQNEDKSPVVFVVYRYSLLEAVHLHRKKGEINRLCDGFSYVIGFRFDRVTFDNESPHYQSVTFNE